MFEFLKKNKPINELPISEAIRKCKKQGFQNLHINLYIEDQILFQVMPAKFFIDHGFDCINEDFAIVHFFNKNKTLTIKVWEKFRLEKLENLLFYYENPKGRHFYLKNVGSDPKNIENEIKESINFYDLDPKYKLSIEYVDPPNRK